MGSSSQDGYEALELYLQQAEAEIGLSLTPTPQTPTDQGAIFFESCSDSNAIFFSDKDHIRYDPSKSDIDSDGDITPVNSPKDPRNPLEKLDGNSNKSYGNQRGREEKSTSKQNFTSITSNCSIDDDISYDSDDKENDNDVFVPGERSSTPDFFPSADKTERIIHQTLRKHKALKRSNTAPNFYTVKPKLSNSVDNGQLYLGNYKFDTVKKENNDSLNGLIDSDRREEGVTETCKGPHYRRSLSTTAVQTSDENGLDIDDVILYGHVTKATNTTDSLERPRKRNKSLGDVVTQSPAKKPTSFPQKLVSSVGNMATFVNDHSPEMQMLVNTTSPVLMRRKPTNRPKTRPRVLGNIYNDNEFLVKNVTEMQDELKRNEGLFMKKDMAKTWHGGQVKKWKKYYAPIMQNMLKEMNNNGSVCSVGNIKSGTCSDGNINQDSDIGSRTLPAKTLLDEMHKKYCAYQYKDHNHLRPVYHDNTLPTKFKSSPPPPDRMRSRSWLLQHYTIPVNSTSSSSPDSPESSPQLNNHPKNSAPMKLVPLASVCNKREATPTDAKPEEEKVQLRTAKTDEEIEAVEASRWLKEAGFPQYAQMYEDGQFPVDISAVERDHDFLDKDSMQSLVRRLGTLNKCAVMRIGTPSKKPGEESEDEDHCALSDKWKYQHNIRRWSRKDLNSPSSDGQPSPTLVVKSSSSNDSLLTDQNSSSETGDSPVLDTKMHHDKNKTNDDYFGVKTSTPVETGSSTRALSPRLRRAASERIKGAKNFIKRMETFKSRKTRRIPRNGNVEISGPVIMDHANMQEKIRHLNCKELSPSSEVAPSPITDVTNDASEVSADVTIRIQPPEPWSDETTNYKTPTTHKTPASVNSISLQEISSISSAYHTADSEQLSVNENSAQSERNLSRDGAKSFNTPAKRPNTFRKNQSETDLLSPLFLLPNDHKPGSFPKVLTREEHFIPKVRSNSLDLGSETTDINANTTPVKRRGSTGPRVEGHRISIYDNVEQEEDLQAAQDELDTILSKLFQDINGLNKAIYGEDAEDLEPPPSLQTSVATKSLENHSTSEEAEDSLNGNEEQEVHNGTISSPDSSDHDIPGEELSHDDSAEHIECRERRDSGVGSSLTRASSDRKRYRIRWHSFQKSHRPSFGSQQCQISNLSVCQLMVLQKLSLCRLTGLIEKYSPNRSGWTWSVPKFMKRTKAPDYSDKNVFGVPLLVTLQRTGQPLPQCILYAMRYLRKTSKDAIGIFRKSGVRSRIQKLKNEVEANPVSVNFEELQAYDVADLLKQYFRELPECLLTNKLSEIFINIFIYLPSEERVEALQSATILLPDENREVLQSLLLFLADISEHASEHQMTASNLAVCFAPSLFNMSGTKSITQSPSPRRPRKNLGVPDARELQEQKAAHECLTLLIQECKKIFLIPSNMISKCRFSYIEQGDPVPIEEMTKKTEEEELGFQVYVDNAIQGLLKESRDKFRGWVCISLQTEVDVSYKKVADGHPLRLWKCATEVEAPPDVVLDRIKNERHIWDVDLIKWRSIEKLDPQTEVFQFTRNSLAPHPARDFCVLRSWKTDLPKGACALVSTSVEHPKAELNGAIQGVVLVSHFLIEPCGAGKSRITHMSRVDMRGRTPEWYKKAYSYISVSLMERIRDSFKQTAEGPESTV